MEVTFTAQTPEEFRDKVLAMAALFKTSNGESKELHKKTLPETKEEKSKPQDVVVEHEPEPKSSAPKKKKSAKKKAAPKKEATAKPEPEAAKPEKKPTSGAPASVSRSQAVEALSSVFNEQGQEVAKKILQDLGGYERVSQVPEDKYGELKQACDLAVLH